MAARAAMTPAHSNYDPSIRLQSSASVRSRNLAQRENQEADLTVISPNPVATSPIAQSFEMNQNDSRGPLQDIISHQPRERSRSRAESNALQRSASAASRHSVASNASVSRSNTLKKQQSLSRKGSLKRSSSKRSVRPASIGGITYDDTTGVDVRSVFYTPVPTTGSPTDILANRFQGWRKFLKDLIIYFREVQASYETRAKAATKVSNTINSLSTPLGFLQEGGLGSATEILQQYHKQALAETSKAKQIEHDVIAQLAGLRSDLSQKIKEIKSLSGDFKNTVEKEKEATKKVINSLQEALAAVDSEAKAMVGRDDPYIVRLHVDRQVERQIDEENYLHRAYLNIEGSGRELESIVVGEIQKAYNAFATILKKEADEAHETADKLRTGPISLPKDLEWSDFIERDPNFVNPDTPLRRAQDLEYPGKYHPASAEVRAGMLERKSKYLKSYTPGWFVLSPTHLHEFKSADSVYTQAPVMSLYLPDQRLGNHSQPDSSSHKFIMKGRQTGAMHRGHSWVFRAESFDTMLAWYDDIKSLIEKSGEERDAFVRRHTRSFSNHSTKSVSSLEEDEADAIPFQASSVALSTQQERVPERPQAGGRFPSDVNIRSDLPARLSPSDGSEMEHEQDLSTMAGEFQGGRVHGEELYGRTEERDMANGVYLGQEEAELEAGGPRQAETLKSDDNSYSYESGRVAAYETPVPVSNDAPEPHQAEFVNATPLGEDVHPNMLLGMGKDTASDSAAAEKRDETEPGQLKRMSTDKSISSFPVPGRYPKGTEA